MSDFCVVDFAKLRSLLEAGSSGVVDVRADLHRALAELDWNAQRGGPAPPAGEQQREAERWLTAEQAAEIVPDVTPERIRAWAKGQKWASRPSRRCLRINEVGFRKWLSARAGAIR